MHLALILTLGKVQLNTNMHHTKSILLLIVLEIIVVSNLQSQGLSGCPSGVIFITPDTQCSANYRITGVTGVGDIEWRTYGASLIRWTDISVLEGGYDFLYGVTDVYLRDNNTSCFFTIVVTEHDQYPLVLPKDTTLHVGRNCQAYYEHIPNLPPGCNVDEPLINSFTGGVAIEGGDSEFLTIWYYHKDSPSTEEHTWKVDVEESCSDCNCDVIMEHPISINASGLPPHPYAILDISATDQGIILDQIGKNFRNNLARYEMYYTDEFNCLQIQDGSTFSNCGYYIITGDPIPTGHDRVLVSNIEGKSSWISATDLLTDIEAAKDTFHNAQFTSISDLEDFQSINSNTTISFFDGLSNSRYTASRTGYYFLSTDITFQGGDGSDDTMHLKIRKNGVDTNLFTYIDPQYFTNPGIPQSSSLSGILFLNKGEYAEVYLSNVGSTIEATSRNFNGFIISE